MDNNELYHHGVKGMKWGVRRYQNKDGTLTSAGRRREESIEDETRHTDKKKPWSTKKKVIVGMAATTAIVGTVYGSRKFSEFVNERNVTAGKKYIEQMGYLQKNINNIPSHVDPTPEIRNSKAWQHAYASTFRSRQRSINGDNALYGDAEWYKKKFPNGRNAFRETKYYMNESLRKEPEYWLKRARDDSGLWN